MFKRYCCVLQKDEKDCGPACILTIAKQYNSNFSIAKLRQISGTDRNGTNLAGMIKGLDYLGFDSKAVKVEDKKIDNSVSFPIIAHIQSKNNFLHYVVVHDVSNKRIIISDPESGIKKLSHKEFSEIWTGILLLIEPKKDFQKRNEKDNSLTRFFYVLKNQKSLLFNIFLASILYTVLGIVTSFSSKFLIDYILKDELMTTLTVMVVGMVILEIIQMLLSIFRGYLLIFLGQRIDIAILLGYYNHVIKLPMNFFSTRKTGKITSRFSDADNINDAVAETILTLMLDVITAVTGGIIVYIQNQYLFFVSIVILLLYIVIVFSFKEILKKINNDVLENNSQLTSFIIQNINGIETIKAYDLEKNIQDETEFKYLKVIKSSFKRSKIYNLLTFLSGVVELIGNTLIMWVGAIQVINGKLALGEMMVFNTLLGYFTNPVKNLISLQPTIQTATVSADRLGEIIDLDIEQSDEKMIPQNLKGDIEIKGLNFRYGTRELILKNINMEIKQGEKIALVGESGSGKTTLAKLILKFYDFEKGDININNFNLKDIDNTFLRNKISYISQDMFLFNKTIKENLMLSDEIEIDDVIELSKKVNAYEFINELPQRFDYMIEENGTNLSTGQKQRLSILRALLKKPDILIMDEATSNLDSITESAIQKTLNNPEFNMTTIIIAHRLSTIRLCDRIYVLDEGEIIEAGTHEELIELKNKYYTLWKEQENIHEN
ncbi:peptidase domain-containing ABC transporter [Leptotrichia sp. oral taxon 847]|uniref:peptidase domain-containing ABC transporter n=1 Tax=Leptotrichia sp. oral taxon 847 TaxID=1785996 RepID=UPI000767FDAE|nr:peptidase domain-containing ABC transporter [Leptotrichia sp. oral taxon 847]AMD95784.1 bacteriocin ABC transporter ATP-binding protein [Leptotrichia sp. oral taxon 847]